MKNYLKMAALVAAVCVTASCEHVDLSTLEDSEATVTDVKKFTFTVKGDFLNPTFTRGNSYMTADGVEMTDLWVVDVVRPDGEHSGTVVQMVHQTSMDADWGSPTMSLTLGTHHVMFLASRGAEPEYADGVVTWTKPLDTFYQDYEVTVVKASNGNRAVTLNRVVTKLQLTIEDAIPQGTTTISLKPEEWFTGWNMLTGKPVAGDNYSAVFNIPSSWWNRTGGSVTAWSLSGSEEWTTGVAVTSKAGDVVNASVMIEGAPFVANRATVYRGNLYSNSGQSSVSLQSEWLPEYEGVY